MEFFWFYLLFFLIAFSGIVIQAIKKRSIIYVIIVIIIVSCFGIYIYNSSKTSDYDSVADGFTIEGYDVVLDVKEDNKVDVTEKITVNWYGEYHHGIYKFTPYWLQYTGKDGKTIKRKSEISNYRAEGDPYSLDEVKRKARIKIGNPYQYVPLGNKTYTIKYTYDMGKDPYKNFDEFIFHAYGDYWGTEIKNATLEVNMPKSIEGYKINFFYDKFRDYNVTENIDFNVDNNKIIAKVNNLENGGIYLGGALTIDIELPEDYFVGGSNNYGYIAFCLIIIIVLITIYIFIMWCKFGKNLPKNAKTVEFYPPEGLNSAEIGYIYNKVTSNKLTISLVLELASKGYIKIDEVKKEIHITNLVVKPKEVVEKDSKGKRTIEVRKLKDIDDKLSTDAKTMMTYLFKDGDIKSIQSNIDKFLDVEDELVKNGYIQVSFDNGDYLVEKEKNDKEEYAHKKEQYEKDLKIYQDKISELGELSEMERIVYNRLFESSDTTVLELNKTFYLAFKEVNDILNTKVSDLVNDKVANKKTYLSMILNLVIIVLYFISYFVEDLNPILNYLYLVPLICVVSNLFFIMIMKKRTLYGEQIYAKVLGFRDFLIKAEKDNLESLVEKDPKYFYNILPYTYVLGVSKKWVKKFENISMPDVDMGNFDYTSESAFHSLNSDVYRPASSGSGSSGSGCSSCGGGCSSCGGGCSSCGGGGSW